MMKYSVFLRDFNPRSREGSDVNRLCLYIESISFQSTLPRGERQAGRTVQGNERGFQSTLPRGERPLGIAAVAALGTDFNPRSREGSDTITKQIITFSSDFNPRSREGSDGPGSAVHIFSMRISIHAPARGATPYNFYIPLPD